MVKPKRKTSLSKDQIENIARTVASAITDIIEISHTTILKNADIIDKAGNAKLIDYNEIDDEEFGRRLDECREKYAGKLDFIKLYQNVLTTTWGQELLSSVLYEVDKGEKE